MNKILKITLSIIAFLFLNHCGFKIVKNNFEKNFTIIEFIEVGDNNINFIIKNKIKKNNSKDSIYDINMTLSTAKKVSVKEKNINNKITKYKIEINTLVEIFIIDLNKKIKFKVNSHGDYNASSEINKMKYNEKTLIKRLSEDISNEILKKTTNKLNDF
jgi:hypothetical protein